MLGWVGSWVYPREDFIGWVFDLGIIFYVGIQYKSKFIAKNFSHGVLEGSKSGSIGTK